jgi:hypothetical protein
VRESRLGLSSGRCSLSVTPSSAPAVSTPDRHRMCPPTLGWRSVTDARRSVGLCHRAGRRRRAGQAQLEVVGRFAWGARIQGWTRRTRSGNWPGRHLQRGRTEVQRFSSGDGPARWTGPEIVYSESGGPRPSDAIIDECTRVALLHSCCLQSLLSRAQEAITRAMVPLMP